MSTTTTTATERTQSTQPKVADLLDELENIDAEFHNLKKKVRSIRAEIYSHPETKVAKENHRSDEEASLKLYKKLRYTASNGLTIHKLRQANLKVVVTHVRYADIPGVKVAVPVPSFLRGAYDFLPHGGATHITITKPNGEWICLSSVCHEHDSFDYKYGVKTALEQLAQEEADSLLSGEVKESN